MQPQILQQITISFPQNAKKHKDFEVMSLKRASEKLQCPIPNLNYNDKPLPRELQVEILKQNLTKKYPDCLATVKKVAYLPKEAFDHKTTPTIQIAHIITIWKMRP
jgi:hypothetical protein